MQLQNYFFVLTCTLGLLSSGLLSAADTQGTKEKEQQKSPEQRTWITWAQDHVTSSVASTEELYAWGKSALLFKPTLLYNNLTHMYVEGTIHRAYPETDKLKNL